MPSKRRLKTRKIVKADIISNLPDFVLSRILSLLPSTEEAVRTSLLSKRWRHVWTYLNKLIFDDDSKSTFQTGNLFKQYVDNVLEHHQGDIKELRLHCDSCNDLDVVTTWIDIAIAKGVEILDLKFIEPKYDIPDSLLTSKTLTVVELNLFNLHNIRSVKTPSSHILPRLKKLHLRLCSTKCELFKSILAECSTLEYLIVRSWDAQIDIVSSSVKRLVLRCHEINCSDQKIVLGVPALEFLEIKCRLPSELIVEDELSSLVEARVYFYGQDVNAKQLRNAFVRFMKPLSNVKVLGVGRQLPRFLSPVEHGLFLNLTKLDIVSHFYEWRLLVSLMENSINLESITLKKTSTLKKHKLAWIEPKKVPTCLSLSLKKISIGMDREGYESEYDDELSLAKYVLRTAQILELMYINCPDDLIQKIQKLPRACERCEISQLKKLSP